MNNDRLLKYYPNAYEAETLTVDVAERQQYAVSVDDGARAARAVSGGDTFYIQVITDAAHEAFEDYTGVLIGEREVIQVSRVGDRPAQIRLARNPVVQVVSVEKDDEQIDFERTGNNIYVRESGDIKITYTAGINIFPAKLKLGIHKYISTQYDDRQNTSEMALHRVPEDSKRLWDSFKKNWFV